MTWRENIGKLVVAAPLVMPGMLAVFGVVTVSCVLLGIWNWYVVAALSAIAACLAGYLIYKLSGSGASTPSREAKLAAAVVLLFTIVWVGFNSFYASQNLYMGRDAQIYAENAAWLVRYDSPLFTPSEAFAGTPAEEEQISRMMLLPYLLSMGGEIADDNIMLRLNPIFGGTALLAVFAFGRMFMRERWAAFATLAFAVTLPLIHFSRDNYTEPMTAAFIFSAMALVAVGWKQKSLLLMGLAGLVTGAGMLIRFDSVLPAIGIMLALFVMLALARSKERTFAVKGFLLFGLAYLMITVIGLVNLMVFSDYYYTTHMHLIWQQFAVLAGVIVVGVLGAFVAWRTQILAWLDKKTRAWRGRAAVGGFVAIVATLASRPLWMVDRKEQFNGLVYSIEESLGIMPDGYRTYAEHTLNWIVWYVGPVLAIGAVIGAAIVLYRAFYKRNIVLFLSITVLLSMSAVYVNVPAITPDQIWASRRFLPVIFPAVILFGAFFLDWLSRKKRLPWGLNSSFLVGVLATLAVTVPFLVSQPFLLVRTHVPQLDHIKAICQKIPKESAVLWVGATAAIEMPQPTRTFCNVPSAAVDTVTKAELQEMYKSAKQSDRQLLVGAFDTQRGLSGDLEASFSRLDGIVYEDLAYEMLGPPRATRQEARQVFLGLVEENGRIKEIE